MRDRVIRLLVLVACALALQACGCATYSNRLAVGCMPKIGTTLEESDFRDEQNRKIGGAARFLGFLTTPFKRIGVFGWRDMGVEVVVRGEVVDSVHSTDGFVTVDVLIEELLADGSPVEIKRPPRYLRAEICERALALPEARWPRRGDRVRVGGRLLWDGDGFLEVHPQRAQQVEILGR